MKSILILQNILKYILATHQFNNQFHPSVVINLPQFEYAVTQTWHSALSAAGEAMWINP